MSAPTRSLGILALSALFAIPGVALAQDESYAPIPIVEIAGGFVLVHDDDLNGEYPGWYFSGGANLNRWFGLVGEATGGYKKHRYEYTVGTSSDRHQMYTFMAGPRLLYPGRVVPFAQFLTGAAHLRTKGEFTSEFGTTRAANSQTYWAIQPGGGLTFYVSERVGFRLAGDYRWLLDHTDDEWNTSTGFRGTAGMTFGWGAR